MEKWKKTWYDMIKLKDSESFIMLMERNLQDFGMKIKNKVRLYL